jgi:hypothetical protein
MTCPYCHSVSTDNDQDNCHVCGAPRKVVEPILPARGSLEQNMMRLAWMQAYVIGNLHISRINE